MKKRLNVDNMNQINTAENQTARDARNERLGFGIGNGNVRRSPSRLPQNKLEDHDYVADMHRRAEVAKAREFQQKQQALQSRIENQRKNRLEDSRKLISSSRDTFQKIEDHLPNEIKEKIEDAREKYHDAKKLGSQAKTLVKSATPWGFFSLLSEINILTDWTYFAALMAAMVKDLLDFVGIGSLPAIGTVITFCSAIFIMFMMILGNMMHEEHDRTVFQSYILNKWIVKWIILLITTIVELLFGANFLPIQTIGVLIIWSFALAARKSRRGVIENEDIF